MFDTTAHVVTELEQIQSDDHTGQTAKVGRSVAGVHVVLSPAAAHVLSHVVWRFAAAVLDETVHPVTDTDLAFLDELGISLHTAQDLPAGDIMCAAVAAVPVLGRTSDR